MDATSRKTRSHRWLAAGLAAVALLAACSRQAPATRPPEPGDVAVATVDGQPVWASDVRREAATQGLIGQGDPLDVSTDLFHRVLDEVIDQKLLAAEALKHHLENDPVAKQRLAAARERILADMLVSRLVEQSVSESSIRGLYDQQVQLSKQNEEFHARQIVVSSEADADALKKQVAGGAAFDSLAMERSIDADTRYNGGDLGYFTIDVMPPAYATALANAKAGDIVGPFKSDAGWVLLKVEDRRPEQPISLDAARPQIVNFLTDEQVGDLLKRLRGQSKIQVMIPPANPNGPGALREPASAPPASLEAPAAQEPLSAASAASGAPAASAAAPAAPITLAPPPSSVILHMAPGAEPALPHLRSPPPASGPPGSHPGAPPPKAPVKATSKPAAPKLEPVKPAPVKAAPVKSAPAKPAPAKATAPAKSSAAHAAVAARKPAPAKAAPAKPPVRPHAVLEAEPMPYARYHPSSSPPARTAPPTSGGPVTTAPPETSP